MNRWLACWVLGAALTGCVADDLDEKGESDEDEDDGGEGAGDGGSGDGGSGGGGDDLCGTYTGDHFLVAQLSIGIDPADYAAEPWDWDGEGIADFWGDYGDLIDFALVLASQGGYQAGNLDLAVQLADAFAPLLMSPYVSPDLLVEEYWIDDYGETPLGSTENIDNTIWFELGDYEVTMDDPTAWWWLEFHDRDLAFDDYAGFMWFDQETFQSFADCGQVTWVLSDQEMAEMDTRVRFVEFEVESW